MDWKIEYMKNFNGGYSVNRYIGDIRKLLPDAQSQRLSNKEDLDRILSQCDGEVEVNIYDKSCRLCINIYTHPYKREDRRGSKIYNVVCN